MRGDDVRARLRQVLARHLNGRGASVRLEEATPLFARGVGLDSLDLVALIVKLEEEFDIFLDADEVGQGIETFGALARVIEGKILAGRTAEGS